MSALKYWIWLAELSGVPLSIRHKLLLHFGSPEQIYYAERETLSLVEGLQPKQIDALCNQSLTKTEAILADCQRLGISVISFQDSLYPARLRNIFEPPLLLYAKGNMPVLDEEVPIAVVGTRRASPYGIRSAEKISCGLAQQGAVVVSGLASGIDAAAHCGALRGRGLTVAVLGCGVDVVYPSENERLYLDIAATGVLLSEYPPGTKALGEHFPVRNRIISGLSLAVLVAEAPERSGAIITAHLALEQGRDVFAVPGAIDAPGSRGCNRLIAEGAGLVADSADILENYAAQYPHKLHIKGRVSPQRFVYAGKKRETERDTAPENRTEDAEAKELPPDEVLSEEALAALPPDELLLLKTMQDGADRLTDDLIEETELPAGRVLAALTGLEIAGYLVRGSGNRFRICVKIKE